ncbi:hypothetical protein ABIE58_003754 [Roseovarius sp. MBR-78]|uniref:DUF2946 family protein n=1 Tax=Roseovarius sp. MBR-78 TaxID=3156460 RepID=UPI0033980000
MNLVGLITRALLLLALLGTGSVPEGMMRAGGADGMRLVLCTTDGPQEAWLTDDGRTIPVEDHDTDHDQPHCVQVSIGSVDLTPPQPVALGLDLRPADLGGHDRGAPTRQRVPSHNRARAPPRLA